ncbi:MAG TPA: DUF2085 domain-containing protein [Bacteroidota bacterium]|nr:DUF2085 domain-containing protein [Bacteroidota bacterium]
MTPRRLLLAAAFLWCASIVAAPVLASWGEAWSSAASVLYVMFSRVCHQMDTRSFHIAGFKFGVCIRCTAIYFSFFLGMILFPRIAKTKVSIIDSSLVLVLSLIPMGIDVTLATLGLHESTVFTRMATGIIFGSGLSVILVPTLQEVTGGFLSLVRSRAQKVNLRNLKSEINLRNLSNHRTIIDHTQRTSYAAKTR